MNSEHFYYHLSHNLTKKKREDLCYEDMFLIEAGLLDTALNSYQNFSSDRHPPENVTPSEFKPLIQLAKKHCHSESR